MDYEEYEEACKKIQNDNEEYLEIFRSELAEKDFYLNHYMLYEEPIPMEQGHGCVDGFFGYFFIRKCMWSTPATIKSTASSIKKFYKCMLEYGKVEEDDYITLCETIKDDMEDWIEVCMQYNDPSQPNPFSFF